MRLIDAEQYPCSKCDTKYCFQNCNRFSKWLDTEAVVRCKDCKHWKPCAGATEHVKCCEFGQYMVGANGYCVYGEVKNND